MLVLLTAITLVSSVIFGLVVWKMAWFAEGRPGAARRNLWWPLSGFTMFFAAMAGQLLGDGASQWMTIVWSSVFVPTVLIGMLAIVRRPATE